MIRTKYWCGGTINVFRLESHFGLMIEEMLLHAWHAIGRGYQIKEIYRWDYRLSGGPNADLTIIGPDGQEYNATMRYITGGGWTLDHISRWRKAKNATSKIAATMT